MYVRCVSLTWSSHQCDHSDLHTHSLFESFVVTIPNCLVHDSSRFFNELFKNCIFIIAAMSVQNVHLHLKLLQYACMHSANKIKRVNHFLHCAEHPKRWWAKKTTALNKLATILFIYLLIVWRVGALICHKISAKK